MSDSYSGLIIKELFPEGIDGLYDLHVKEDSEERFIIQLIGRERDDGTFAYYTGDDFVIVVSKTDNGAVVHRLGHGHYKGKYTHLPTETVRVDDFIEAREEVKALIGYLAL